MPNLTKTKFIWDVVVLEEAAFFVKDISASNRSWCIFETNTGSLFGKLEPNWMMASFWKSCRPKFPPFEAIFLKKLKNISREELSQRECNRSVNWSTNIRVVCRSAKMSGGIFQNDTVLSKENFNTEKRRTAFFSPLGVMPQSSSLWTSYIFSS